jgi:hypothetical protein
MSFILNVFSLLFSIAVNPVHPLSFPSPAFSTLNISSSKERHFAVLVQLKRKQVIVEPGQVYEATEAS